MQQMNMAGDVAEMVPRPVRTAEGLPLLQPGEARRMPSGSILFRPARPEDSEAMVIAMSHISDMVEAEMITEAQGRTMLAKFVSRI